MPDIGAYQFGQAMEQFGAPFPICATVTDLALHDPSNAHTNPTNGLVTILGVNLNDHVTVYDAGMKLIDVAIIQNGTSLIFDLTGFAEGVYLISVDNIDGLTVHRLSKIDKLRRGKGAKPFVGHPSQFFPFK